MTFSVCIAWESSKVLGALLRPIDSEGEEKLDGFRDEIVDWFKTFMFIKIEISSSENTRIQIV